MAASRHRSENSQTPLDRGQFVRVADNDLGTGKLVSITDGTAEIAYFDTPASEDTAVRRVPVASVELVNLQAQCRVYWLNPLNGAWFVGRVEDAERIPGHLFDSPEDLYWVAFPNSKPRRVPVSQLQVRWSRPLEDPVAYLAARTTETPYWHLGRASLQRSALQQRAQCNGLTGLCSASVDLLPHQYRVVRAVLNDPVQRYLLADEVGLGKTIEAAAVLRQYVLEHPTDHSALVVVPPHLRDQWLGELGNRFHLESFLGQSIHVVTLGEMRDHQGPFGMLIVDEAHHAAAHATSWDDRERVTYAALARLASATPRLLLLSATPVLRNESGFLAMLHLLDPAAYRLDDAAGFRHRVQQRQAIAELQSDLQDDAPSMFVEDALAGLRDLLPEDQSLLGLLDRATPLADEAEDHGPRREALAAIRAHVGELYRLHRRMLRNRRGSLPDLLHGRAGVTVLPAPDPERGQVEGIIDDWRAELAVAVHRGEVPEEQAVGLWKLLLDAIHTNPRTLRGLLRARVNEGLADLRVSSLARDETALLLQPELYEGEFGLLQEAIALLEGHQDPALDTLAEHVRASKVSHVVFASDQDVADDLASALQKRVPGVLRHREQKDVDSFSRGEASVLVCDRTAEEGLNLHLCTANIVHFDIPLSPNRIEQRIGRVDRFGARRAVKSVVFDRETPFTNAWRECLTSEIGVFDESVASLQYVLEEHLSEIDVRTMVDGLEAFTHLRGALRDDQSGLTAERDRIRHQEDLDALEANPDEEDLFLALEDFDLEHDALARDFDSWLVGRILFRRHHEDEQGRRVRYEFKLKGARRTLITLNDWFRWFSGTVKRDAKTSSRFLATPVLTWNRRQAWKELLPLVRLGHPLFDGALAHAKCDDRGVAFAMWRWRPECGETDPVLSFRFDFIIEADSTPIHRWLANRPALSGSAIRRQLDSVLQPSFRTVWLNDDLVEITDPAVLEILNQPYEKRPREGGADVNLTPDRWEVLEERVAVADWASLVRAGEGAATEVVKGSADLAQRCEQAKTRLSIVHGRSETQALARLALIEGDQADAERASLMTRRSCHAAMLAALAEPEVRVDSTGAVFLADWNPFARSR